MRKRVKGCVSGRKVASKPRWKSLDESGFPTTGRMSPTAICRLWVASQSAQWVAQGGVPVSAYKSVMWRRRDASLCVPRPLECSGPGRAGRGSRWQATRCNGAVSTVCGGGQFFVVSDALGERIGLSSGCSACVRQPVLGSPDLRPSSGALLLSSTGRGLPLLPKVCVSDEAPRHRGKPRTCSLVGSVRRRLEVLPQDVEGQYKRATYLVLPLYCSLYCK